MANHNDTPEQIRQQRDELLVCLKELVIPAIHWSITHPGEQGEHFREVLHSLASIIMFCEGKVQHG